MVRADTPVQADVLPLMVRTKVAAQRVGVDSAAVYARISADVDGSALGVTRRLQDCRKLAADRGWPVGAEYVDNDVSAYSGKPRPQYERMLADLAAGARDAVIVYNLDRLHRSQVRARSATRGERHGWVFPVPRVPADCCVGAKWVVRWSMSGSVTWNARTRTGSALPSSHT